jgi:CheY-like chemotaxis protein
MTRALIIDDDAVRVPVLKRYLEGVAFGDVDVTHSTTFTKNWDDFDIILLDHDLGEGGDVSEHVRAAFPHGYGGTSLVVIHSMNPVGAMNIRNAVGYGHIRPFSVILSQYS